jgi:flavin reductase (DIM6/NTAB) family NADH-FMN oxidoreductase RutF
MMHQVEQFGAVSGPLEGKLNLSAEQLGSVTTDSTEIRSPGLKGYLLNVECRVLQTVQVGLYDCFLGQVLAIHGRSDVIRTGGHPRGDIDYAPDPAIMCLADEYWSGGEFRGYSRENKDHFHGDRH